MNTCLARLWPFVFRCVGTEAFVCCHRALVAGSAAEVFACRIEHPECENSNRYLFPQALRYRAWHRRAKVELRGPSPRSGRSASGPLRWARSHSIWPFGISVRIERHLDATSGSATLRQRATGACMPSSSVPDEDLPAADSPVPPGYPSRANPCSRAPAMPGRSDGTSRTGRRGGRARRPRAQSARPYRREYLPAPAAPDPSAQRQATARQALLIVQPETVLRRHRQGFASSGDRNHGPGQHRRRRWRPRRSR